MIELYPDRETRDRVLDLWMANLPDGVREAMTLLGMSDQEYRERVERMLWYTPSSFTISSGGTVSVPAQTWHDWPAVTTGSVTVPCNPSINVTYGIN